MTGARVCHFFPSALRWAERCVCMDRAHPSHRMAAACKEVRYRQITIVTLGHHARQEQEFLGRKRRVLSSTMMALGA